MGNDKTFMVRTNYVLPERPISIAVADYNTDGNPDVAFTVTFGGAGPVTFLGSKDGTIRPASKSAVPATLSAVAGDFDRDGRPDLVTVVSGGALAFLRGNGAGTFQSSIPFASDYRLVNAVDFNKDGNLDIIAMGYQGTAGGANQGVVSVFEGRGDGSFQLRLSHPVGVAPEDVTTADLNGDQIVDIVVSNRKTDLQVPYPDPSISVLIGKKDGTFSAATNYGLFVNPSAVCAGDLTSDGILDLVIAEGEGLAYFVGVGDGTFQPVRFLPGSGETDVTTGDFNGDGKTDVVVADESQRFVRTYVNACALRPELSFRRTDAGLLLSWPTFTPPFHLESAASLAPPTWKLVTDVFPENRNGRWEVLIPTTKAERFFRLTQ